MKKDELVGLDTNVLIYADDPSSVLHPAARGVLEEVFRGLWRACISPQILAEYYSVITSVKRCKNPLSAEEAKERVVWLNRVRILKKIYPRRSVLRRSVEFCAQKDIRGPRIFDVVYGITLLDYGVRRLKTNNVKDFLVFEKLGLNPEPLA